MNQALRFGIHCSLASLLCAGCGATNPVDLDTRLIWEGRSNQVMPGGYWFTYADHIAWMAQHPEYNPAGHTVDQGASITPLTNMTSAMPIVSDPDTTSGHGDIIHVWGTMPAAPSWSDVSQVGTWFDTYYQQATLYPGSLNVAYPVAGVGFGFVPHNAPTYDPSGGGKYVGIAFDMKTRQDTAPVDFQLALVCSDTLGNDLHDDYFEDAFGKPGCTFAQAQNVNESLEQQAADYLSGPQNYLSQTCFLYQHKSVTPNVDGQWSRYCVLYNEMTVPDWASSTAQPPPWTDETLRTCATKAKWEMWKPADGDPASPFDVYLDNIRFVTRADAAQMGCDISALPADPTRVIGPTSH